MGKYRKLLTSLYAEMEGGDKERWRGGGMVCGLAHNLTRVSVHVSGMGNWGKFDQSASGFLASGFLASALIITFASNLSNC